jgi:hypothetical protein
MKKSKATATIIRSTTIVTEEPSAIPILPLPLISVLQPLQCRTLPCKGSLPLIVHVSWGMKTVVFPASKTF